MVGYHLKCIYNIAKEECEKFGYLAEKSVWYCTKCKIEVKRLINRHLFDFIHGLFSPHLQIVLDQLEEVNSNKALRKISRTSVRNIKL